jgi:hypothetical protein
VKVDLILACLLAEMNAIQEKIGSDLEKMETNQERMDAKIGAEVRTIQVKI